MLLPAIVLLFGSHNFDRTILAIVLAFFFCAINVYAMSYRKLFQRVVEARVDQQQLAESLAEQKQVAEEASLAKTRFFAAASHDLRQPLHAIGLLAASLNDASVTPAQHAQTADHIVNNVEALNQLFNQVLDLARLESGVTQVIRLHFRLDELFERVGSQYRPQAAAKGLALRIAPTTMVVHDDPVLLERVLSNLLSNAVRYTEEGAIWMGLRRAGRRSGGYIEVRDSGIGIPRGRAGAHLRGVLSGRQPAARRAPGTRARPADGQAADRPAGRRVELALGAGTRLGVPLSGAGGRPGRACGEPERRGGGRPVGAGTARAVHRR